MLFTGNNTTDIQEMQIEDVNGVRNFSDFVGGTILRTIVDIVLSPTYEVDIAVLWTLEAYFHLGMFLTEDDNPNLTTRWDPNKPFGDFMHREMAVERWYRRDTQSKADSSHNGRMHWDVRTKRRIREAERLWMAGRYFNTAPTTGGAIGYTGRVLIQLP